MSDVDDDGDDLKGVTFKVFSAVPGYRGEGVVSIDSRSRVANDEGVSLLCLRDIVDWYCRQLGREVLSDDDYVLEVLLSPPPPPSSAQPGLTASPRRTNNQPDVVVNEVEILAPDTEIAELALPSICHIHILDAQTTTLPTDYGSFSGIAFFKPRFFQTLPPRVYFCVALVLLTLGILFMVLATTKSGTCFYLQDQVVVVYVALNTTQLSGFTWLRKQFPYSTVDPSLIALQNLNLSLSLYLDNLSDSCPELSNFSESLNAFVSQSQNHSAKSKSSKLSSNIVLMLEFDYTVLWPQTYTKLGSKLVGLLKSSGFRVVKSEFENRTEAPVIEWMSANYEKPPPPSGFYRERVDKRSGAPQVTSGVLHLSEYSSFVAFPYNSSYETTATERDRLDLFGRPIDLYASSAACFGETASLAGFLWHIWETSNFSGVVVSGCYSHGSIVFVNATNIAYLSFCIPDDIYNSSLGDGFRINGTGSSQECMQSMRLYFARRSNYSESIPSISSSSYSSSHHDNLDSVSPKCDHTGPGKVCQPILNASNHFYATGLLYETALQLNLTGLHPTYEEFESAVNHSCDANSTVTDLLQKDLANITNSACLRAIYVFVLLTERGYGLANNTWNVTFEDISAKENQQAKSVESYLMLNSLLFPDNDGEPPLRKSAYAHKPVLISFGIVFLIFAVLAWAIFRHQSKKKRSRKNTFAYHEFE